MYKQQDELVGQLQDQHYEQYVQHVQPQLLLHKRQQLAQLRSLHLHHQQQQLVTMDTSPSNQLVETGDHDDKVAMVTGEEMNGALNDEDGRHGDDDDDNETGDFAVFTPLIGNK